MAIPMQGAWTVTVKSKNAAFNQRFVISGATSGNGSHSATVGSSVFVTGTQWSINVQSQSANNQPWVESRQRLGTPAVSGGLVRVDIRTDDVGGVGDLDFNDLVLTCSMPLSATDFIVYGNAKTYQGRCLWNPCYPWYAVIETSVSLAAALKVPRLKAIIEKLYPERIPRPGPNPPPPDPYFKPIVIPTGTPVENNGLVFRSTAAQAALPDAEIKTEKDARRLQEASVALLRGSAQPVSFDGSPVSAGLALLAKSDVLDIAKINDKVALFPSCDVNPAPGLLLRFLEYDRTNAEKLGGPYTGGGAREVLGLAVTDEVGNYIFRFSRSLSDIADETLDVAAGETLATQIFPDVIVQALGTGMHVDYESAPYYNIPNLTRINLCLPYGTVHPSTNSCQGVDRTIVKIGDIIVLHSALSGHPNTLDSIGRITSRNVLGPTTDCAAWRNIFTGGRKGLSVYGCLDKNTVTTYTVRYKRVGIDATFRFVEETHKLNFIPDFGPFYDGTKVGPFPRTVDVDGTSTANTPTYDNRQGDSNWIENDLKILLDTDLYTGPAGHGSVDFKIQGYNSGGHMVVEDTIRLYLDNRKTTGFIKNVNAGVQAPDDCALLTLPTPNAALTVQYRVDNPEGFLHSWALSVTRGNNYPLPVIASGVIPQTFPAAGLINPCHFEGTEDYPVDADGFTNTILVPAQHLDPGDTTLRDSWLPVGKTFCAFAFVLSATDRVTDGRAAYPTAFVHLDLVGLNGPAPTP
jgi:hypothetical protein